MKFKCNVAWEYHGKRYTGEIYIEAKRYSLAVKRAMEYFEKTCPGGDFKEVTQIALRVKKRKE